MYLLLGRPRRLVTAERPKPRCILAAAAIIFLVQAVSAFSQSQQPVILVHGFGGWGRADVPGFYYWGGLTDLEGELRKQGYCVHTAAIGLFSSNWDRACELYAFIKGGRVDYGEHHAALFEHERYGETYPGVYPEWDKDHPVHLVGHSMGGQTARLLAFLIRHGDPMERSVSGNDCHPLFESGGQWIRSITTLSTPHNGTTLINDIALIDGIIKAAMVAMATVVESELFPDFDLKLGQWGIMRYPDESLSSYFRRLRESNIWSEDERDFSLWDTSVEGAAQLNERTPADPEIYYFSYANEETRTGPFMGYQIPEIGMLAAFVPGAFFLGSYIEDGTYKTDESWWSNDGVVNTISMKAPFLGSKDRVVDFDGDP
ncbi:MAG: alpha/beta fold hydrolase, partial [Spirochaetales bacterium]|nr:alpha/beta fold hydrolase [Spirochaetales bacterium]